MARTTINRTTLTGPYPALPLSADSIDMVLAALTGASGSSGNQTPFGDFNALVGIFQNTDGASARTITFTSVADILNRFGDVSAYSMGIGEFAVFRFERTGWRQSDGMLYYESSSANVKAAFIGVQ